MHRLIVNHIRLGSHVADHLRLGQVHSLVFLMEVLGFLVHLLLTGLPHLGVHGFLELYGMILNALLFLRLNMLDLHALGEPLNHLRLVGHRVMLGRVAHDREILGSVVAGHHGSGGGHPLG